jgi:hypothetical protein
MPPNGPARSTRVDGSTGGQTFTSVEPVTGRRRRRCGGSGGRATSRAARQRCAATLGADAVRHSSDCAAPCGCSRLDCPSGCTWSWAATPHWLCWRMPILSRRSRPAASAPSTTRAGVHGRKPSPCRCSPRRGIHDAYQQEIFGPVAPILAFKDIDEAAQLAAQTGYGSVTRHPDDRHSERRSEVS